jgi:NitT/TauT family transport system substrate-binding protein
MAKIRSGVLLAMLPLLMLAAPHSDARAQTPIDVGIVSRTVFFVPLWIADQKGYLKHEGFDTKIEIVDSSDKINDRLRSGHFQFAISSPESIIAESYQGGSLRLIAGNAKRLPHFIIAKPAIKTLADLKGATIGVLSMHDGTTFLLGDIAKAAGLQLSDFKVEAVGGAPTRWKLLQAGQIDAGLQPFPLSYEADAAGFTDLGPVLKYIPDYQFSAILVDENWAKAHREQTIAFLRALQHGTDTMLAHPDEAAAIAATQLDTTPALARRALNDTERYRILPHDLSLSSRGLRRVFVALQDAGVVGRDVKYDSRKFVDDSYLKASRQP